MQVLYFNARIDATTEVMYWHTRGYKTRFRTQQVGDIVSYQCVIEDYYTK